MAYLLEQTPPMRLSRIAFLTLFPLALLAVLAYALWVEPARLTVVRHDLRSVGAVAGGAPWRLVQVSDLHLQAFGEREQALARQVQACFEIINSLRVLF